MVTGPASHPAAVSSSRVATMSSRTLSSVAFGLLPACGSGLDRVQAAGLVPGNQAVQVLAGVPAAAAAETDSSMLMTFRTATRRLTCRVLTVTYVANPDTLSSTSFLRASVDCRHRSGARQSNLPSL